MLVKAKTVIVVHDACVFGRIIQAGGIGLGAETLPAGFTILFRDHWAISEGTRAGLSPRADVPAVAVAGVPRTKLLASNAVHYHPGNATLAVTFHHMGAKDAYLSPWGGKFIVESGIHCLALRPPRQLVPGAYSALHPGATVALFCPRSTLNPKVVPWEKRCKEGRRQPWQGAFTDAAEATRAAGRLVLVHDPRNLPDGRHIARFDHPNILSLQARYLGHRILTPFPEMGILKPFMRAVVEGRLDDAMFRGFMRERRRSSQYLANIAARASRRRGSDFAARIARLQPAGREGAG